MHADRLFFLIKKINNLAILAKPKQVMNKNSLRFADDTYENIRLHDWLSDDE